ncbi:MAG: AMP-binding protein [Pseudolabrys sp.]
MILSDYSPDSRPATTSPLGTLDGLFRRAGVRHADVIALADPPNRETIDGVAARWFTYSEADRAISAIAATLRELDLPADTIVAYQLPNTVENVLTFLGILRAGMIAAPLPLLWRKADIVGALTLVGAKVFVTSSRVDGYAAADTAMQAAADLFQIRFVCGFGDKLSDGIVPLDPLLSAVKTATVPALQRAGDPSAHIAVITWETTERGPVPVARSHAELLAAAPPLAETGNLFSLLSATPPTSFAGIALTLVPWLIRGGTLHLHHGFTPEAFAAQASDLHCETVIVPGPLVGPLLETDLFGLPDLRQIVALWRAPETLASATPWTGTPRLIDATAFGELGLAYAARSRGARPAGLASTSALEVSRAEDGTLILRGTMTPAHDFPPGPPQEGVPHLARRPGGILDTGYRCRSEPQGGLVVTAPPPGIVGIGGYRLARNEIDTTASLFGSDTAIAVLPSPLTGQRLAGASDDRETVHALLTEQGSNALLAGAFAPLPDARAA